VHSRHWRAGAALAVLSAVMLVAGGGTLWRVLSVHTDAAGSPMGGTVSLLTFPDLGLAIAAAANVTNAGGVNPFATQVAAAFTRR